MSVRYRHHWTSQKPFQSQNFWHVIHIYPLVVMLSNSKYLHKKYKKQAFIHTSFLGLNKKFAIRVLATIMQQEKNSYFHHRTHTRRSIIFSNIFSFTPTHLGCTPITYWNGGTSAPMNSSLQKKSHECVHSENCKNFHPMPIHIIEIRTYTTIMQKDYVTSHSQLSFRVFKWIAWDIKMCEYTIQNNFLLCSL